MGGVVAAALVATNLGHPSIRHFEPCTLVHPSFEVPHLLPEMTRWPRHSGLLLASRLNRFRWWHPPRKNRKPPLEATLQERVDGLIAWLGVYSSVGDIPNDLRSNAQDSDDAAQARYGVRFAVGWRGIGLPMTCRFALGAAPLIGSLRVAEESTLPTHRGPLLGSGANQRPCVLAGR